MAEDREVGMLVEALELALPIIEAELAVMISSYTNLSGPDIGLVTDKDALATIKPMEAALAAGTAALSAWNARASSGVGVVGMASDNDLIRRGDALAVVQLVSENLQLGMLEIDGLHRGLCDVPALQQGTSASRPPSEGGVEISEAMVTAGARAIGRTDAKLGGPVGKYLYDVDLVNAARACIREALSSFNRGGGR